MLPVDYAKTRYQIARPGDPDDAPLLRLMQRTYAKRGFRGLYAGVSPVLLRAFPTNAVGVRVAGASWNSADLTRVD